MKYLSALLIICSIVSCSDGKLEKIKGKELQVTSDSILVKDTGLHANAVESINSKVKDSIPEFAKRTMASLSGSFSIDSKGFLQGDFNADNKTDFTTRLTNLKNGKKGIIVIHNSDKKDYYVFGAGKEVSGMDDLDWIDQFAIIPKGETVAATLVNQESGDIIGPDTKNEVQLQGNGIFMHVDESEGGAIIYWNGRKYECLHIE